MRHVPGRRTFLKTALGGAAGLSLSVSAIDKVFAQSGGDSARHITVTRLSEHLFHLSGAGANVVALVDPSGVVLVDGGLAEHSTALLKAVAELAGGASVKTLFNTHWHPEHTGSNAVLGKAGVRIIAHENTKRWLGGDFYVPWQERHYKPQPPEALPNDTFYTTGGELTVAGRMTVGNERIEYIHVPQAHTDGDVCVFFREANVLVAGNVVSVGQYPIPDCATGGSLPGLAQAGKDLLALVDEQTRIVPGVGPVQTRADLQVYAEMLTTVYSRAVKMLYRGFSARDMVAQGVTEGYDAKWGKPDLFIANAYQSMWGHVREFEDIV